MSLTADEASILYLLAGVEWNQSLLPSATRKQLIEALGTGAREVAAVLTGTTHSPSREALDTADALRASVKIQRALRGHRYSGT